MVENKMQKIGAFRKKKVLVKFIGFDPKDGNPLDFILFNNDFIKGKYEFVESDNPNFVFYQPFFQLSDLCKYENSVKIFITGEPLHPDLNFFDYHFGFENDNSDRTCFFPHFLWDYNGLTDINYDEAREIVKGKNFFCDFIYGHEIQDNLRKRYFYLLNSYKRVEAAGKYLNNQESGKTVHYEFNNPSKLELQNKCKFSLCIQWVDFPWFINEKIIHSFQTNEIPIFYGTETVKRIFNPKRFIFINDFKSDDELLKRIIELDEDDEKFARVISEPIYNEKNYDKKIFQNAIKFLDNILSNGKIVRNQQFGPNLYLKQIQKYEKHERFYNAFVFRVLRKLFIIKRKKENMYEGR